MFIVCRLDFAVASRVVFKVFPCCLWGGRAREPYRATTAQTSGQVLVGEDSS
ncbi:hypothetical protein BFJ67_g17414 [Fusarium oxysporum f. sp. cepae]|nr:hypothetical protein BFJ67_g17414 [Fusarium oxysporum f. sp. cepae]